MKKEAISAAAFLYHKMAASGKRPPLQLCCASRHAYRLAKKLKQTRTQLALQQPLSLGSLPLGFQPQNVDLRASHRLLANWRQPRAWRCAQTTLLDCGSQHSDQHLGVLRSCGQSNPSRISSSPSAERFRMAHRLLGSWLPQSAWKWAQTTLLNCDQSTLTSVWVC